ncbi:hypothetical protein VE02_00059 [Pseudogymnoascus sp. 03VT05]|nr:hypothetical protein VE02_00059 [Pseudogymnoascus sp. 03VT05]
MTVPKPPPRILILGSGVVGSSLAHVLSTSYLPPATSIQVLSPPSLTTSTSLAPVGGLEIASTAEGIKILEERAEKAWEAGLEARLIDSEEIAKLSPQFHEPDEVSRGLYFPTDGVAEPSRIVSAYQASARSNGVEFISTTALGIKHLNKVVKGVNTSSGFIGADKIIVASGIWSGDLLKDILHIPVIPVAHPYLHGAPRAERGKKSPFRALGLFPEETRREMMAEGGRRLNGVFAVTPDGLPVVGAVGGVKGLWVAAGVWVTHAVGVAEVISKMVLKMEREIVEWSGSEGSDGGMRRRRRWRWWMRSSRS